MNLTFEEQAYYDEFAKVYNRYGNKIPDDEWLRLSEVRKGLGIDLRQSTKIAEDVELETYKKKYLSQHPEKQLDKVIVKVTEKDIVAQHHNLKEKRKSDIAEFHEKTKKLRDYLREQETLEAPKKVEDSGSLNFLKIIFSYAIGVGIIWYFDWLWVGIAVLVIETWVIIEHISQNVAYEKYKDSLDEYVSTKERLKNGIPQLKVEIEYLKTVISDNLYSEINGGCSVPLPKYAINECTWDEMAEKLDELVVLYSQYKSAPDDTLKKEQSMKFFNKKLEFFYDESIRYEAGSVVFKRFGDQLHDAISKRNINLLRVDLDENTLLTTKKYDFSTNIEDYKSKVESMDISHLMSRYDEVKDMGTSGFLGLTNIDKLSSKTQKLQQLYSPIKHEYDRLRKASDEINYYLTYVRTVAYRNIYLGVELLNYIRDNAGGRSLMTQKDKVSTGDAMDVGDVSNDKLQMDSIENVANTLNGLVSDALENKQIRDFAIKNPKMAAGAAALAVIGSLVGERVEKIENNNELQKQLITSISQMVDGYNSGKASLLRAIEVIKALSKANIGFLAIYAPLRDKFFLDGCTKATMLDLQNLAKATQEYKHISDTKL